MATRLPGMGSDHASLSLTRQSGPGISSPSTSLWAAPTRTPHIPVTPPPTLFSSKRLKRPVYSHHPHSLRNPPPSVCCPPTPWRLPSRSFSLTPVFPTNTLVPFLFLYAMFKMDTFHHSVKPSSLSFRSPGRLVPPPTLFSESPPSVSSVSRSVSSVFPSQAHGPFLSPCPRWAPSHVIKSHPNQRLPDSIPSPMLSQRLRCKHPWEPPAPCCKACPDSSPSLPATQTAAAPAFSKGWFYLK